VTDKLQRVLNAAARFVSGTHKYDDRELSQILHADLHLLDVADRVRHKLVLQSTDVSPQQSAAVSGRLLRSSVRHHQSSATIGSARGRLLTVPRHRRSTLGRRVFSVAGPTVWNWVPDQLRDSDCTESTFRQSLKTFFFRALEVLRLCAI